MKLITIFFLCISCTTLKRNSHAAEYKIASYNTQNLFDLHNDKTEYPLYKPNQKGWGLNTARIKYQNIAKVLSFIDADIVGLQEIENENALRHLLHNPHMKSRYPYTAFAKGKKQAVGVAVLSKYPIIEQFQLNRQTSNNSSLRPMLQTSIKLSPYDTLTTILCHWPSRKHQKAQREAIAQYLFTHTNSFPNNNKYLIFGDLNSYYDEVALCSKGRTILNTGITDNLFVTTHSTKNINLKSCFYTPWIEIPPNDRWSYYYRGEQYTLDHFLLPASLLSNIGIHYKANSFKVVTMNNELIQNGKPYGWQISGYTNKKRHQSHGYSDHLPIVLTLTDTPQEYPDKQYQRVDGFEWSNEGWYTISPSFKSTLCHINDSLGALHITGKSKSNSIVVSKELHRYKNHKGMSFSTIGTGKISVRYGKKGNWTYCTQKGSFRKSPQYETLQKGLWYTWYIPLDTNCADISIQIRSYAGTELDIYLDRIKVIN